MNERGNKWMNERMDNNDGHFFHSLTFASTCELCTYIYTAAAALALSTWEAVFPLPIRSELLDYSRLDHGRFKFRSIWFSGAALPSSSKSLISQRQRQRQRQHQHQQSVASSSLSSYSSSLLQSQWFLDWTSCSLDYFSVNLLDCESVAVTSLGVKVYID